MSLKFKFSNILSMQISLKNNSEFTIQAYSTPSLSNIRLMLMLHIQLDLIFISLFSISDFILCTRDHRVSMHVFTERVSVLMAISHDGDLLALSLSQWPCAHSTVCRLKSIVWFIGFAVHDMRGGILGFQVEW